MAPASDFLLSTPVKRRSWSSEGFPVGGPGPARVSAGAEAPRCADRPSSLLGGWCQGVLDRLEQAVPQKPVAPARDAAPMLDLFSSLQCLPRARCSSAWDARDIREPRSGRREGAAAPRIRCTVPRRRAFGQLRCEEEEQSGEPGRDRDGDGAARSAWGLGRVLLRGGATVGLGLQRALARAGASAEARASAAGAVASALTPLVASSVALVAPGGCSLAFCPFPFGCMEDIGVGVKGLSLNECSPFPDLSLQELEKGILVATFVQGSLGLLRICLGDFFSGAYTLLLATVGFNARHPGPASNWLKTYVLITFINGTMGSIDLIQNMLLQNFPYLLATLPLKVNLVHLVQLSVPGVSFIGAYCGWQHIKMQRRVAMDVYHQQLMLMMEQAPWPPEPLPLPLPFPGMQMQAGMPPPPMGWPPAGVPGPSGGAACAPGPAPACGRRSRLAPVEEEPEQEPPDDD